MIQKNRIDNHQFFVVNNPSGRCSIWPARKEIPYCWSAVYGPGPRADCMAFVARSAEVGFVPTAETDRMQVGLMFFGDNQDVFESGNKYQLVLEAARYADQNGLSSIWLPERHFTQFGCLFSAPATLHAALARETERIRLRAGSIVMPLNDPLRVAEAWAVVDNLSGGRVDLSFASGWHPDDFALTPDQYADRYDRMYAGIDEVRRLWRGESLARTNGVGQTIDVRTFPSPIQPELPVWLTAASRPETFAAAGKLGANLLTHLFDQDVEDLASKIQQYRQARAAAGFDPATGRVTVTLHTFIAETLEAVKEHAQAAYCGYMKSNFRLLKSLASSRGMEVDLESLTDQQVDQLLEFLFEKFVGNRSLLGTPQTCLSLAGQLEEVGVNELACLIDFGPAPQAILDHLPLLTRLQEELG